LTVEPGPFPISTLRSPQGQSKNLACGRTWVFIVGFFGPSTRAVCPSPGTWRTTTGIDSVFFASRPQATLSVPLQERQGSGRCMARASKDTVPPQGHFTVYWILF
jgi:hypothetical protein